MSRDLDSEFNEREEAGVREWLTSDYAFHFMRDHPMHGNSIMGGLWGLRLYNYAVRQQYIDNWPNFESYPVYRAPRNVKGQDQQMLHR